ncbi:MAG TPA: hypothetical protein VMZ01_00180, partial [Aestuariivirga sp.]|nr:hypothetical protein [Aestuariivirga sp.]
MIDHLKESAGIFGPDELKLLGQALGEAWSKVLASGAYRDDQAERARAVLAKHIIQQAQAGERDPAKLC